MARLILYSQSGHMIQPLAADTTMISVPKSIDLESILAIDSTGKIVPFSFLPETTITSSLTDRQTGEKVEATVTKNGQAFSGKILSLDPNQVSLNINSDIITIRKYDSISVRFDPSSRDVTRPRLVFEASTGPFTLSYLLSNISWSCHGTALINDTQMYLRLAGSINNNTESDISANVTLISGHVYQQRPKGSMMRAMAMSVPGPITSTPEVSSVEDYTKYDIGSRTIHHQNIVELGTMSFPITKIYIHQTNEEEIVRFGYRFRATGFIPRCAVNIYSTTSSGGIDTYLGASEIKESRATDEIDLLLGESSMLQCRSQIVVNDTIVRDDATAKQYGVNLITSDSNRSMHVITEDLTVEITNHHSNAVALVCKHSVLDKLILNVQCANYTQRKDGFIEWYFSIPGATNEPRKETFKCQIITTGYF